MTRKPARSPVDALALVFAPPRTEPAGLGDRAALEAIFGAADVVREVLNPPALDALGGDACPIVRLPVALYFRASTTAARPGESRTLLEALLEAHPFVRSVECADGRGSEDVEALLADVARLLRSALDLGGPGMPTPVARQLLARVDRLLGLPGRRGGAT